MFLRVLLALMATFTLTTHAQTGTPTANRELPTDPLAPESENDPPFFSTTPRYGITRTRNYVFPPLASFFVPGLGQVIEQQWEPGLTYAGTAGFGLVLAQTAAERIREDNLKRRNFDEMTGLERQYTYGMQLYLFAGEMSAFHSFRTSIHARKQNGQFTFLEAEEDTGDLLLAPFAFEEVLKPTTYLPLLAGLVFAVNRYNSHKTSRADFDGGDAAFTGGVSFNAGVGEEAFFRGYMMPVFREWSGSDFWSNSGTAVIFGAAHYGPNNRMPIFQTLAGYYFGWLTQRNKWSLKQSIFVHTWWDIIVIGAGAARNSSDRYIPLPGVNITF